MIVVTKTRCTILFSAAPTEFPKFGHIRTESMYCGPQATLKQELHAEPRLARALIIAGHQEARIQTERPVRERRGVDERLHVHLPRIERRLVDVEARASPAHVVVLVRPGASIEPIQDVSVRLESLRVRQPEFVLHGHFVLRRDWGPS